MLNLWERVINHCENRISFRPADSWNITLSFFMGKFGGGLIFCSLRDAIMNWFRGRWQLNSYFVVLECNLWKERPYVVRWRGWISLQWCLLSFSPVGVFVGVRDRKVWISLVDSFQLVIAASWSFFDLFLFQNQHSFFLSKYFNLKWYI